MITSETVDSDDEDQITKDQIQAEKRNFKCLCNARLCPDKVWTEEEKQIEQQKRKRRESNAKKRETQKKRANSSKETQKSRGKKRKRESLNDTLWPLFQICIFCTHTIHTTAIQ